MSVLALVLVLIPLTPFEPSEVGPPAPAEEEGEDDTDTDPDPDPPPFAIALDAPAPIPPEPPPVFAAEEFPKLVHVNAPTGVANNGVSGGLEILLNVPPGGLLLLLFPFTPFTPFIVPVLPFDRVLLSSILDAFTGEHTVWIIERKRRIQRLMLPAIPVGGCSSSSSVRSRGMVCLE